MREKGGILSPKEGNLYNSIVSIVMTIRVPRGKVTRYNTVDRGSLLLLQAHKGLMNNSTGAGYTMAMSDQYKMGHGG